MTHGIHKIHGILGIITKLSSTPAFANGAFFSMRGLPLRARGDARFSVKTLVFRGFVAKVALKMEVFGKMKGFLVGGGAKYFFSFFTPKIVVFFYDPI